MLECTHYSSLLFIVFKLQWVPTRHRSLFFRPVHRDKVTAVQYLLDLIGGFAGCGGRGRRGGVFLVVVGRRNEMVTVKDSFFVRVWVLYCTGRLSGWRRSIFSDYSID